MMMLRKGAALMLALGCAGALAAGQGYGVDQLMADLAQAGAGRARFVETRTVALLDRPLQFSGELRYTPPDTLEKHTEQPSSERLVLKGDILSIDQGERHMSFNVGSRPEAMAFVESVRSTLAGNREVLQRHFALALAGERAAWTLVLTPTEPIVQRLVTRITMAGSAGQVRSIVYDQADGDRSEMTITPIEP